MDGYQALLLVSFGGPERAEDVLPFLRRVTAGRDVPEDRIAAVAEHYYAAGGASPINSQCRAILSALQNELAEPPLRLYWGNRNWDPMLEDTVAQMRDDGIERALAFVTSAYGGYSSCRQYLDDIAGARARVGAGAPTVEKLRLYYNHPGWVEPWASSLARALGTCPDVGRGGPGGLGDLVGGNGVEVIFTAHSIPMAMAETSPYVQHVTEAARLIAASGGTKSWRVAWQSRSGRPGTPWLEPDVCAVIEASRARAAVVVPIGFVCDNMEIIYDLDVEAAEAAKKKGTHFVRAATVSSCPEFIHMIGELVRERVNPGTPRRAMGRDGPWVDICPEGHCPAPGARPKTAAG
jgi:protoporphyrin/coproporphyrin ferrochelatase